MDAIGFPSAKIYTEYECHIRNEPYNAYMKRKAHFAVATKMAYNTLSSSETSVIEDFTRSVMGRNSVGS